MYEKEKQELAKQRYEAVPIETREDLIEAVLWAKKTLTEHEGSGHIMQLHPDPFDGRVCCNFSKPEWPGEHSGSYMSYGSEAVVMAVCEYLCGL